MPLKDEIQRRQIWAQPSRTSSSVQRHCTPFEIPSNGVLIIDKTSTITLTRNAVFRPQCTSAHSITMNLTDPPTSVVDLRDPFYSSTSPQIYAVAATTVVSYMLVIVLLITPRTFFVGGAGGGSGFLGRRGMISGASGTSSAIGVGGRPWLQKVATLMVAISLTIATVDTFNVAENQYDQGFQDADLLTAAVVGGLQIRVVRVISTTVLWLAQVQTLIRLFPRHREKVIIKWTGFALIVLDTVFSILNSFVDKTGKSQPRTFKDAMPALTYLFELALSLLYAAWVIYYSLEKRRFAFIHPKMHNICLVALLSLTAILIPVIFFVLDISKPAVSGWGDYVRWVGAAAASVVVWEWVERIEALERDERKDGILGREIFDGDEMLETTPSSEINWPGNHHVRRRPDGDGGNTLATSSGLSRVRGMATRTTHGRLPPRYSHQPGHSDRNNWSGCPEVSMSGAIGILPPRRNQHLTPPPAIATPISRADTTSATSTVYAIHYHPISASTSPDPEVPQGDIDVGDQTQQQHSAETEAADMLVPAQPIELPDGPRIEGTNRFRTISNPFKRRRTSPPLEVFHASQLAAISTGENGQSKSLRDSDHGNPFSKLRFKTPMKTPEEHLPLVVIPAQPRGTGRVWSPALAASNNEDELGLEENPDIASFTVEDSSQVDRLHDTELITNGHAEHTQLSSRSQQSQDPDLTQNLYSTTLSQRGTLSISEESPQRGIYHNSPSEWVRPQIISTQSSPLVATRSHLSQIESIVPSPSQVTSRALQPQSPAASSSHIDNPQSRLPP